MITQTNTYVLQRFKRNNELRAHGQINWGTGFTTNGVLNPPAIPQISIKAAGLPGVPFEDIVSVFVDNSRCRSPLLVTNTEGEVIASINPGEIVITEGMTSGTTLVFSAPLGSQVNDVTKYVLANYFLAPSRMRAVRSSTFNYVADQNSVGMFHAAIPFTAGLPTDLYTNTLQGSLITDLDVTLSGVVVTAPGTVTINFTDKSTAAVLQLSLNIGLIVAQPIPFARLYRMKAGDYLFGNQGLTVTLSFVGATTSAGTLAIVGFAQ